MVLVVDIRNSENTAIAGIKNRGKQLSGSDSLNG